MPVLGGLYTHAFHDHLALVYAPPTWPSIGKSTPLSPPSHFRSRSSRACIAAELQWPCAHAGGPGGARSPAVCCNAGLARSHRHARDAPCAPSARPARVPMLPMLARRSMMARLLPSVQPRLVPGYGCTGARDRHAWSLSASALASGDSSRGRCSRENRTCMCSCIDTHPCRTSRPVMNR